MPTHFPSRAGAAGRVPIDEIYELATIDRWFLHNLKQIVESKLLVRGLEARVTSQAASLSSRAHRRNGGKSAA